MNRNDIVHELAMLYTKYAMDNFVSCVSDKDRTADVMQDQLADFYACARRKYDAMTDEELGLR